MPSGPLDRPASPRWTARTCISAFASPPTRRATSTRFGFCRRWSRPRSLCRLRLRRLGLRLHRLRRRIPPRSLPRPWGSQRSRTPSRLRRLLSHRPTRPGGLRLGDVSRSGRTESPGRRPWRVRHTIEPAWPATLPPPRRRPTTPLTRRPVWRFPTGRGCRMPTRRMCRRTAVHPLRVTRSRPATLSIIEPWRLRLRRRATHPPSPRRMAADLARGSCWSSRRCSSRACSHPF